MRRGTPASGAMSASTSGLPAGLPVPTDDGACARLTPVVRDGRIEHVFYPVFPPDRNPDDVLAWLDAHPD